MAHVQDAWLIGKAEDVNDCWYDLWNPIFSTPFSLPAQINLEPSTARIQMDKKQEMEMGQTEIDGSWSSH